MVAADPTTENLAQAKPKGRVVKWLLAGLLGLVGLAVIAHFAYAFSGSSQWEYVGKEKGVTVYAMKTPGETLKKFKAVVRVKATMAKIVMFMQDQDNDLNVGFYRPRELKREGTRIQWTDWRGEFPTPFQDRQFIVKHEFSQRENKEVYYQLRAVPDMLPPDDCCVRVPRMDNNWTLRRVGDGETEIEWIIDMDVGGFMPYFVINQSHPLLMYDFASRLQGFFDQKKYDDAHYDWIDESNL